MNRDLKLAYWLGCIPLAVGLLIFLLWFITRWFWLPVAGLFWIVAGMTLFGIGFACWCAFLLGEWEQRTLPTRQLLFHSALSLMLLLVNFPGALLCVVLAADLMGGGSAMRD